MWIDINLLQSRAVRTNCVESGDWVRLETFGARVVAYVEDAGSRTKQLEVDFGIGVFILSRESDFDDSGLDFVELLPNLQLQLSWESWERVEGVWDRGGY